MKPFRMKIFNDYATNDATNELFGYKHILIIFTVHITDLHISLKHLLGICLLRKVMCLVRI